MYLCRSRRLAYVYGGVCRMAAAVAVEDMEEEEVVVAAVAVAVVVAVVVAAVDDRGHTREIPLGTNPMWMWQLSRI